MLSGVDVKGRGELFADAREALHHLGAFEREARHAHGETQLRAEARPGIARNRDVIHFGELDAGLLQAIVNRARGKTRGVLHAIEALFFDGGDQAAVHNDRRRGVARDTR